MIKYICDVCGREVGSVKNTQIKDDIPVSDVLAYFNTLLNVNLCHECEYYIKLAGHTAEVEAMHEIRRAFGLPEDIRSSMAKQEEAKEDESDVS